MSLLPVEPLSENRGAGRPDGLFERPVGRDDVQVVRSALGLGLRSLSENLCIFISAARGRREARPGSSAPSTRLRPPCSRQWTTLRARSSHKMLARDGTPSHLIRAADSVSARLHHRGIVQKLTYRADDA